MEVGGAEHNVSQDRLETREGGWGGVALNSNATDDRDQSYVFFKVEIKNV